MSKLFPQSIKNIYHLFQAVWANIWFGFPSKKLKVIGVTGTNGKTTTVQMITRILESTGAKVAMASTINFKLADKEWVNDTKFTTLSSFKVQQFLKQAVEAGCVYAVLETSSHSLDQNRVWGVLYDTAVITNVTREHLDYHKTMEEYRRAKRRLFDEARAAVVNLDMERPEEYLDSGAEVKYGYSTKISNFEFLISKQFSNPNFKFKKIIAEDINLRLDGTNYKLKTTNYRLSLPGLFNVENALAATSVGLEYGIPEERLKEALEKIKGVPGRLESVPNDLGVNIIIDYAVTPDSLEKLYAYVSQMRDSKACHPELVSGSESKADPEIPRQARNDKPKIIAVFGSCGERDRGKRPMMGEIVSRYADHVIITNEDPYHEDPWQIMEEVAEGVDNKIENENFWMILDRREAIAKALELAKPGDIVLVTGKGAEEIMAIGDQRIPWNDKKVILEELGKIKLM